MSVIISFVYKMSVTHPVLDEINQKVRAKYNEMYEKELNDPKGRHRSIDGVIHVHPEEDDRIRRECKNYRIQILEQYVREHC